MKTDTQAPLKKHQKAILKAILSHNIWGAYIAFSIPFTACTISAFLVNLLIPTEKAVGITLVLILSVVFAMALVKSARRARDSGDI
ncbi:MAG: hypothetical protein ABW092_19635 [Candidatus Thiodiazotropha sp.]